MHSIGTFFSYLDCFAIDSYDLFIKKFKYDVQYFGRWKIAYDLEEAGDCSLDKISVFIVSFDWALFRETESEQFLGSDS